MKNKSTVLNGLESLWAIKKFRYGVMAVVFGLICIVVFGLQLGALLIVIVLGGAFAIGGALFESVTMAVRPRTPVTFKTQPVLFVAIEDNYINLAHVTYIKREGGTCVIYQTDDHPPIYLKVEQELELMDVVRELAVNE